MEKSVHIPKVRTHGMYSYRLAENNCLCSDVSQSICLTLACYGWAEILPAIRTNEPPSLNELIHTARCSWPTKGGLTAVLKYDQDDWHLPLAPPFHVRLLRFRISLRS
jgi:hypothetical protein